MGYIARMPAQAAHRPPLPGPTNPRAAWLLLVVVGAVALLYPAWRGHPNTLWVVYCLVEAIAMAGNPESASPLSAPRMTTVWKLVENALAIVSTDELSNAIVIMRLRLTRSAATQVTSSPSAIIIVAPDTDQLACAGVIPNVVVSSGNSDCMQYNCANVEKPPKKSARLMTAYSRVPRAMPAGSADADSPPAAAPLGKGREFVDAMTPARLALAKNEMYTTNDRFAVTHRPIYI